MGKLTGQTIADSYDQLVIVDDANGINSSLQPLESADTGGGVSALQIATNLVKVKPSASDEAKAFSVNKADDTGIVSVNTVTEQLNVDAHDASSKGLALGGTLVTASATELNVLNGNTTASGGTIDSQSRILMEINNVTLKKEVHNLETHLETHFSRFSSIPLWAGDAYLLNYSNSGGADLSNCDASFNTGDYGNTQFEMKLNVFISENNASNVNFQLHMERNDSASGTIINDIPIPETGWTYTSMNNIQGAASAVYESPITTVTRLANTPYRLKLHGWVGSNNMRFNEALVLVRPIN